MYIRYLGVTAGGNKGPLLITDFTPPTTELRNDYRDKLNADGQYVSRDYLGSSTWAFSLVTNKSNLTEALEVAAELERVWKAESVRQSQTTSWLSYSHDGETWYRVYGRPGRFTSITPDVHAHLGVGKIDLEFVVTDPRIYAEDVQAHHILAVPASTGGFLAPIETPIMTTGSSETRAGLVVNNGDVPSPMSVTIYGPCTDPTIYSEDGREIKYEGSLASDMWVRIDATNHNVMLRGGAQVPGRLSRRSRLSMLSAPPGKSHWYYRAIDETGTSRAELSVRSAYSTFK